VLHLNMPALAAASPPPIPVIAVAHGCVATWWEAANPDEPLSKDYRWHCGLMAEGLRSADRLAAPSAAYARIVAKRYGLSRVPAVVHNGRAAPSSEAPSAMHDCVLTAGRLWDRVKRTALLDQVAEKLTVPFHAAGPIHGPQGEYLATEHLHLLGTLDAATLMRHLASRPVFVSAATFEPFGLAVLEAASMGCALVLSDIPTFRELWDCAAVFVMPDDAIGFVRAIDALIGDSKQRLQLGEAARRRAARYSADAMADAMLALYADTLRIAA
jgi:glycosyltransferase involved in cell wall biosynthesis